MKKTLLFAAILLSIFAKAQTIKIKNPSFENIDSIAARVISWDNAKGEMNYIIPSKDITQLKVIRNINDWFDCGSLGETPPDIHPTNIFGVNWEANDGKYYLGMVTRDNGTWEALGQKLPTALKTDTCYELTAWLMCSPIYNSQSRKTGEPVNYDKPTRLRIWGGNEFCETKELLYVSKTILSRSWFPYSFVFKPKKKMRYLRIEAFYTEGAAFYNGNLLLDNLSDITPCSCSKIKNE